MKTDKDFPRLRISLLAIALAIFFPLLPALAQKVHTSYLWHMDQPVYWADKSKDKPESKQFAEESHRLKMSGGNRYPGSTVAHPTNDLQEIFSKDDRVNAYQSAPRNAVASIKDLPNAGAQLSISAGLLENIQSLGLKYQWGYTPNWMNPYKEAIGWKTSGGFPRLDVVGFTYDHAFSPFVSERTLVKQIKAHQYVSNKYYGYVSKGYWPAECSFSERIIRALRQCGIEWSVVANSHLARTLSDYVHPYNGNGNIDAPNRADQVPTKGVNWYDATIDGRGSRLAAPYSYQAHKAQYVDPASGQKYTIDVVPMCNYISYVDGYSGASVGDVAKRIEPFSDPNHPSIVLLAHDGDNAWGGGSSYYNEAVTSFTHAAANAGYEPVTIQQFLKDHPVPANDIVRVEDGGWVNAESDWGHPQFINWLWPLYSKTTYRFDPEGWTEDARNWAVITATDNYVTMAEDLEGGNLRIDKISDGGAGATNAEKAWHFYFGGLNSGFMYYGKAEDMEVKPSMTGNIAIDYAKRVIDSKAGEDRTAPSVFIPQRFPYNPGGTGWGPITGYKKVNYSSDFHVWTFAYDVSGIQSVRLKYRTDKDGWNPIESIDNETYAGGSEVNDWITVDMTRRPMAPDPTDDKELNFFIRPNAQADLCYAEIAGYKDVLIDYYVEAVDAKGNVFRTDIQHVYVGTNDGESTDPVTPPVGKAVTWDPASPSSDSYVTITSRDATAASKLHWGVNGIGGAWKVPHQTYRPEGTTVAGASAVETPFRLVEGKWQVVLGPFTNPEQEVSKISFVINHGNNKWDNNSGADYHIAVKLIVSDNPLGKNFNKEVKAEEMLAFAASDFGFSSPRQSSFGGIKLQSLPTHGVLTYAGKAVQAGQLLADVSQLSYVADYTEVEASDAFKFVVTDSEGLDSKLSYTATVKIKPIVIEKHIKVSFKRPDAWGTTPLKIWAWTAKGNVFNVGWPGMDMVDEGQGWFSYTFDPTITSVNVVFNRAGSSQTVDIMNITDNVCYVQQGWSGNRVTVTTTNCENKALRLLSDDDAVNKLTAINVYPQPARDYFVLQLPNMEYNTSLAYQVMDMSGNMVLSGKLSDASTYIQCGKLNGGMYFIRVTDQRNTLLFTSRLLIR